ncbi:hypothetical protein BDR06DRAFT_1015682 [Suillus hirtellus]|nr:hypothetical protein BDR06DRAFT_1015682 [Suillus hirtellus]
MLAINSEFSRPNVLGEPSLVWPINSLTDCIRFNQPQFPDGFPPPAIVETMPFAHGFMPPARPDAIEATPFQQVLQLPAPAATDQEFETAFSPSVPPSVDASWPDYDHDHFGTTTGSENHYENSVADGFQENSIASSHHTMFTNALVGNAHLPPPTVVFHEHIVWKGEDTALASDFRSDITDSLRYTRWNRPLFLTKCLYLGSLWIGLANPWDLPERDYRMLVTNCFLSAVDLSETTIQELHDNPLIVTSDSSGHKTSIGWKILRLTFSTHIANRTSEMRKVIRGCIVFQTGFSGDTEYEKNAKVDYYYALLNSDRRDHVQRGIIEIAELQLFIELSRKNCRFIP